MQPRSNWRVLAAEGRAAGWSGTPSPGRGRELTFGIDPFHPAREHSWDPWRRAIAITDWSGQPTTIDCSTAATDHGLKLTLFVGAAEENSQLRCSARGH